MNKEEKKHLDAVNQARVSNGMPLIIPNKRDCLKCNREFLSKGSMNRLCEKCKAVINKHYER